MTSIATLLVAGALLAGSPGGAAAAGTATGGQRGGAVAVRAAAMPVVALTPVASRDAAFDVSDPLATPAMLGGFEPVATDGDIVLDRSFGFPGVAAAPAGAVFTPRRTLAARLPEPASWAMMILGMGMVGYAVRRRVRASETAFDARILRIAAGEDV